MDIKEVSQNNLFDKEKLLKYLNDTLKTDFGTQITVKQFIHGQSNPTFLLDVNGKKMVLRKKPNNSLLKSAHLIDREFRIISVLHRENFPVPKPILFCSDPTIIGTEFFQPFQFRVKSKNVNKFKK